jgi:glucose-6-phosphate 1-epimerase
MSIEQLNASFGIPGHLTFVEGAGGLPMARIVAQGAEALVSVYAGQVLQWRPAGQAEDVFFLSGKAYYAPGKAIKGGAPVCWPWFGADPEGKGRPGHGFVRNRPWDVRGSELMADGRVRLAMGLTDTEETRAIWPHAFDLELEAIVGDTLTIALDTRNHGSEPLTITDGLHSYFRIGDIAGVRVTGLNDKAYIDKMDGGKTKMHDGVLAVSGEMDRIFLSPDREMAIEDWGLGRHIVLRSTGSRSAVVWNPWIATTAGMGDLEPDDYLRFLCVETTNAGPDVVTIPGGHRHELGVEIAVRPA